MKSRFTPIFGLLVLAAVASFAPAARGQQAAAASPAPTAPSSSGPVNVEQLIRAFAAKETEFRKAFTQYSFKRDAVIQTIGMGGQITGEYHRVSKFVFDDSGKRYEKILFFPMPTLTDLQISPADLDDLQGVNIFALEADQIDKYNLSYVGKERVDELNTHVFDVSPKVMPDPKKTKERLFQGRIWVDDQDLQIVKARGKGVPEGKERFPTFEVYREQFGRYWFPTYTYADEELVFPNGQVVHIRMRVKLSELEKLSAKVRVIDEGEPGVTDPSAKPNQPEPSKPKP